MREDDEFVQDDELVEKVLRVVTPDATARQLMTAASTLAAMAIATVAAGNAERRGDAGGVEKAQRAIPELSKEIADALGAIAKRVWEDQR